MIRWLKNRKEKKEKRRKDKHRRILNALKSRDTTGSNSDYGFYSDEFMRNCETEITQHDYEEINDLATLPIPPQFTKVVGTNFKFSTGVTDQPPQLPARVFSTSSRSMSATKCREYFTEEKFRERAVSLPCFERRKKFPLTSDADEEPFYNEPWDCKSNLTVECVSKYSSNDSSQDVIHVRLFEKCINKSVATKDKENETRWSRLSIESKIYSEIEDSDNGCELDTLSQTESDCSVFTNRILKTLDSEEDDAFDSDASSGFCEELADIDEEHRNMLMKSLGHPENAISSPSLFRRRSCKINTYPSFPCSKIYEDADMYLVPKRCHSLRETKTEKLDLPIRKKTYKMEQRRIRNKNINRT